MKYSMIFLLSLAVCTPSVVQAETNDQEIQQIKQEVERLKDEIGSLKQQLNQPTESTRNLNINHDANRTQWGCYLDDVKAGSFYGTGSSEAEARGKTLQKCSDRGGACFEVEVKCSQSK
ncbi:hypothetical protein [Candidatus Sororendozoicomonas aggregata]|uniref:hypothetical protein n=1 Tax=Candidatus Sororendozoicomonas aggregata TaxID=3073239 RepID=UPI002ED641AC